MTATFGASVLVILAFFTWLCTMLFLAVHMESTLQHPRPQRRRVRVPARPHAARTDTAAPPGSRSARPRM